MLGASSSDRETNGRVSGRAGDRRRAFGPPLRFFRRRRPVSCPAGWGRRFALRSRSAPNRHGHGTPPCGVRDYALGVGGGLCPLPSEGRGCAPARRAGLVWKNPVPKRPCPVVVSASPEG